eukprot:scaffold364573_cov16-Prasinocladus_malaysianus.AAC.2
MGRGRALVHRVRVLLGIPGRCTGRKHRVLCTACQARGDASVASADASAASAEAAAASAASSAAA